MKNKKVFSLLTGLVITLLVVCVIPNLGFALPYNYVDSDGQLVAIVDVETYAPETQSGIDPSQFIDQEGQTLNAFNPENWVYHYTVTAYKSYLYTFTFEKPDGVLLEQLGVNGVGSVYDGDDSIALNLSFQLAVGASTEVLMESSFAPSDGESTSSTFVFYVPGAGFLTGEPNSPGVPVPETKNTTGVPEPSSLLLLGGGLLALAGLSRNRLTRR